MTPLYFLFSLFLGVLPVVAAYPEVIPGRGLPSLRSLNLTSEQLYTKPFTSIGSEIFDLHKRSVDFTSVCMDTATKGAPQADIIACFNYLNNLSNQNCAVNGGNGALEVFCTANNTMVVGVNIGTATGTSSRCDYVAFGVGWTYCNCIKPLPSQNNNLVAAGSCAAYGNGALRVDATLVGTE